MDQEDKLRKNMIFEIRFPGIPVVHFHLRLGTVIALVGVFVVLPWLETGGPFPPERPVFGPVPALAAATKFTGVLHFGRGSRNWRESELRLAGGVVLPLRCKLFLAADACFNLKQGQQYEGMQATVWWDPGISVLQLQVGDELVIRYSDTAERFARPPEESSKKFVAGYFILLVVLLLVASRFIKLKSQN